MDSAEVKAKLTTDDIIKLCCALQEDDTMFYDTHGHPIFNTKLDHAGGDSYKLYYYPETGIFVCYTSGKEGYDVFGLVQRALGVEFREAFNYVVNFFNLRDRGFHEEEEYELTDDWDIFQRIQDFDLGNNPPPALVPINENLLQFYGPYAAPVEWQRDGISPDVMKAYGIRVDAALHKVIIGHRDINGNLIGIRGRSYDPFEIEAGKKYMPVYIENQLMAHPLGQNLYGLCYNKETISKMKKVLVVESEKSVMQLATMYGVDHCFAVATCGSSFSRDQMGLLLSLDVDEIILGYDREFDGGRGDADTIEYEAKLLKIVSPLLPYVSASIIMDYDHLLPEKKMSPTDAGQEVFEKLYHSRVRLQTRNEQLKEKLRRRNNG